MKNVIQELTNILHSVALAVSREEQVSLIVESISRTMDVEVCSLYLPDEQNRMVLLASHGLAAGAVRNLRLPAGKGLVGLVAATQKTINISDAEQHPAYFYAAETQEERFHGFCAAPLVNKGVTTGVLVVQSSDERQFSADEEGFLVTLAAQLALLLTGFPLPGGESDTNQRLQGVAGASGIAIGNSYFCAHGELYEVPNAPCEDVEQALKEWEAVIQQVKEQLEAEQSALGTVLSSEVSNVFSAYGMLLADPEFTGEVAQRIRDGNWLPAALRQATQQFAEFFLALEDPYLQARHEDIHYLGNKLYHAWQGGQSSAPAELKDVVLVGQQITASDIAAVPPGELRAVVSFDGSALSHTAVLAGALGVPAVMGTGPLPSLMNGQPVIVDGNMGQILVNPSAMLRKEYQKLINEHKRFTRKLDGLRDLPALTQDGHEVRMFTNTGLLTDITPGLNAGAQGVGLYRTEIPFMVRDSFPSEEEQKEVYHRVLAAYAGKPVYMRTLDIGGDKQLPYFKITDEENPALGWRGIRFALDNRQLFTTQVRAMLRAAGEMDNLHILLPMISSTQEIDACRALLADALAQLAAEGVAVRPPKMGIMVEVPAAISQIPAWKGKVDFLSIGSNDLSQYLLALDRNNARVASRYDNVHPAVLREIQRVVKNAEAAGIPLSLCGEMAADPVAVVLLLGMGLKTLSMSASRIPRIKWLIRNIELAKAQALVDEMLLLDSPAAIRELVGSRIAQWGLAEGL